MSPRADLIEVYVSPGETYLADAQTRVRSLLGSGGIFTLWHPERRIGFINHFNAPRRSQSSTRLDAGYGEEALALALLEMGRAHTRPQEYLGRIFAYDDSGATERLQTMTGLLDCYGIPLKTHFVGHGNLIFEVDTGEVWMQKHAHSLTMAGKAPGDIVEVYLYPGEWHFGDENTRIKTILGSCVSFTLWHPQRRIGGMCHYMLPARANRTAGTALDGKYADEALELLVSEIRKENTHPREYIARVFGGGSMLDSLQTSVSERNVATARGLVLKYGFRMDKECLGGLGHRNIVFDIWSGEVRLKKHTR